MDMEIKWWKIEKGNEPVTRFGTARGEKGDAQLRSAEKFLARIQGKNRRTRQSEMLEKSTHIYYV
jgi:hypothetical protein